MPPRPIDCHDGWRAGERPLKESNEALRGTMYIIRLIAAMLAAGALNIAAADAQISEDVVNIQSDRCGRSRQRPRCSNGGQACC
jgi:hypothetical protein